MHADMLGAAVLRQQLMRLDTMEPQKQCALDKEAHLLALLWVSVSQLCSSPHWLQARGQTLEWC